MESGAAARSGRRSSRDGFTMIELMVVIAIIILAAGVMGPTIADFFKNRHLDAVRGIFGSVLTSARMTAVEQGRQISVVFFQEGPRTYDELSQRFTDDATWDPEDSFLNANDGRLWYKLGGAGADGRSSWDPLFARLHADPREKPSPPFIPPYALWSDKYAKWSDPVGKKGTVDTSQLFKVTFQRDGTLQFGAGFSDVPTAEFNVEPDPKLPLKERLHPRADIEILQKGNKTACFIDLKPTGQSRSKVSYVKEIPRPPGSGSQKK